VAEYPVNRRQAVLRIMPGKGIPNIWTSAASTASCYDLGEGIIALSPTICLIWSRVRLLACSEKRAKSWLASLGLPVRDIFAGSFRPGGGRVLLFPCLFHQPQNSSMRLASASADPFDVDQIHHHQHGRSKLHDGSKFDFAFGCAAHYCFSTASGQSSPCRRPSCGLRELIASLFFPSGL